MRTTLSIDDDVLSAAKLLAERERKSVGAVISNLARQGLSRTTGTAWPERNGIPLLPVGGNTVSVTLELVHQMRDE